MERWYQLPQHRAIQKQAYNRWWWAAYLRKWRLPTEDEGYKGRVMCETRISTGRALDTDETARLCQILQSLSEHAVLPFESLKGEFESQPYQLVGPVQQAPP